MSDISDLYDAVMAEQREKTASAEEHQPQTDEAVESPFDAAFFDKVASNDPDAVAELNEAVAAARAEGATDEQIDAELDAMMAAAYGIKQAGDEGGEQPEAGEQQLGADDDFEQAKVAAFNAGAEQALIDVLESDLAKTAGVTLDDLADFDLGGDYALGYAQTREHYAEAVEKIAAHKEASRVQAVKDYAVSKGRKGFETLAEKLTPSADAMTKKMTKKVKGPVQPGAVLDARMAAGTRRAKGLLGGTALATAAGGGALAMKKKGGN